MAKLDWKKLEQAFRREHARTGIKLQDWCRQNNISYGTARRYIKMRKKVRKLTLKKAHKKMRMELMTSPVMTSLTAMMAVMKNAQKTAQIRQKRNATADRVILTPLPGLATVTPTP